MSDGRRSSGLYAAECRDVACVAGVERGRRLGDRQLGADRAGKVGVRRLPGFEIVGRQRRVEEHGVAELGQRVLARPADQLGDVRDVDVAALVQGDGERVGGRGDDRLGRRWITRWVNTGPGLAVSLSTS